MLQDETIKPVASVIVPVYNGERTIAKTVMSIIDASRVEVEIIIVDDGSTDATGAICSELSKRDSRIAVYQQDNSGVSAARNRGLDLSSGRFVFFCDADDQFETGLLDSVCLAMNMTNADLCFYESSHAVGDLASYEESKLYPARMFLETALLGKITTEVWRLGFTRDLIKANNITFDETIAMGEDQLFSLQCLQAADCVAVSKSKRYLYNADNNDSATHTATYRHFDYVKALRRFSEGLPENDSLRALLNRRAVSAIGYCIRMNCEAGVEKELLTSWLRSSEAPFFVDLLKGDEPELSCMQRMLVRAYKSSPEKAIELVARSCFGPIRLCRKAMVFSRRISARLKGLSKKNGWQC